MTFLPYESSSEFSNSNDWAVIIQTVAGMTRGAHFIPGAGAIAIYGLVCGLVNAFF